MVRVYIDISDLDAGRFVEYVLDSYNNIIDIAEPLGTISPGMVKTA